MPIKHSCFSTSIIPLKQYRVNDIGPNVYPIQQIAHDSQSTCTLTFVKRELEPASHSAAIGEDVAVISDVSLTDCSTCLVSFTSRQEQASHYRSDSHRYNLKRKLRSLPVVSEDVFLSQVADLSSISGSESENDSSLSGGSDYDDAGNENCTSTLLEGEGATETPFAQILWASTVYFSIAGEVDGKPGLASCWSSLLTPRKSQGCTVDPITALLPFLRQNDCITIVMMLAAGHFAGAIFKGNDVVCHKTFHKYTVRAKRGTAQATRDAQGGAVKSAGASLRRYCEASLEEDIRLLLDSWKEYICTSALAIFLRAPGRWATNLFFSSKGKKDPPLKSALDRGLVRSIPFPTRRPTFAEVRRVHSLITSISVYSSQEIEALQKQFEKSTKTTEPADGEIGLQSEGLPTPRSQKKRRERGKKEAPGRSSTLSGKYTCPQGDAGESVLVVGVEELEIEQDALPEGSEMEDSLRSTLYSLVKAGDCAAVERELCASDEAMALLHLAVFTGETLLHVAARHNADMVTCLLNLGANLTIRNSSNQPPCAVSENKSIRNAFRRYRARYPDKYEYQLAQVPDALDEEMEREKAQKLAQKKREKRKEKKLREAQIKEEEKIIAAEEEQKKKFLLLSDREKRALAAERRIVLSGNTVSGGDDALRRCFQCGSSLGGRVPFEYHEFQFCTMDCLHAHRTSRSQAKCIPSTS